MMMIKIADYPEIEQFENKMYDIWFAADLLRVQACAGNSYHNWFMEQTGCSKVYNLRDKDHLDFISKICFKSDEDVTMFLLTYTAILEGLQ